MALAHIRRTASVAAAASTAVALLALAACGGSGHGSGSPAKASGAKPKAVVPARNAADVLSLVEKRTGSARTAHVESTIVLAASGSQKVTGDVDWTDGVRQNVTVAVTGGSMADYATLLNNGAPMRMRFLPDAYHLNAGAAAPVFGGKHWIKYTYADLDASVGESSGLAPALESFGPTPAVNAALAAKDVRAVGQETVRGVAATHYRGTVDATDLATTAAHLTAAQTRSVRESLTAAGASAEVIDLWISADRLPVKVVTAFDVKTARTTATTYYSAFGEQVTVEAPAASDVIHSSALARLGQQKAAKGT
ncbi:hypothetical protein [Actinacidiphila yeochonensis]|uniref:hypothetical protein n=1 Tax=Actinacidiphila yeochonensis TaxID=89050 RepID=UPI00056881E2|nr:hypothetical protein [Actinacidiphila yeochonensis]